MIMKRMAMVVTVVATILCLGSTAFGFLKDDIEMHGFVSQGYIESTDNNMFGDSSDGKFELKEGSFEFNEIGISFAVPITDELRFGAQIFSRDLLAHGNNELLVDWAFLDYSFQDWLGFRAGKIKMPFGLYNRQRDADMLRTFILLPQSVYLETYRPMVVAFQGFSIYGSTPIGPAGELDYEVFTGTFDAEVENVKMSKIVGGMLGWGTPLPGLRFSITYNQADGDFLDNGMVDGDIKTDELSVYSAEYEYENITLAAELHRLKTDINSDSYGKIVTDREGWYVSASWRTFDWLELGAYYSHFDDKAFDEDPEGNYMKILFPDDDYTGYDDYYSYQKDMTLSVRFNMNEWWCIKVETHFIEGVGLIEEQTMNLELIDMEKNWNMYAVKTSLSF